VYTTDFTWTLLLAASLEARQLTDAAPSATTPATAPAAAPATFAVDADARLVPLDAASADHASAAVLTWVPGQGWASCLPPSHPASALLDLYLPVCSATASRPITVGHLGQSLDGFIATHAGDSQFVTGNDNIVHLHRMRALSDAVVVGAGTVAADNPQLTTRLVAGPHPLRVVFDPSRRLPATYRIFSDDAAPVLYLCDAARIAPGETHVGLAPIVGLDARAGDMPAAILRLLRARGCSRVFVEGGGVTVSAFLEANLLDRLQIAVAPLLIGDGRPAIRLAPQASLRDCLRPGYRVFRMGGDVLFDCDLHAEASVASTVPDPLVTRII